MLCKQSSELQSRGWLVDTRLFAVALALYGPEVALMCPSHKVYASVLVAEGFLAGKVRPEPDVFEETGI